MRTVYSDIMQHNDITKLVDKLGVGVYRDAKAKLGIWRFKPFKWMTRMEADMLIVEMGNIYEKSKERATET